MILSIFLFVLYPKSLHTNINIVHTYKPMILLTFSQCETLVAHPIINITGDLNDLSIHSEYDETDEVILGDSSSLNVSHVCQLCGTTFTKMHIHFS